MTRTAYLLEVSSRYAGDDDRSRAEAAVDESLVRDGITTAEQFRDCFLAYVAQIDDEPHDATLAAIYERAQQAGSIALTAGWAHNDDASCIELSPSI